MTLDWSLGAEAAAWTPLRLNHYVVKSREEFLRRKRPRGRATTAGMRDPAFFAAHDRNLVADPAPDWLVEATRAEKRRLLVRLWLGGWLRREPALVPAAGGPGPRADAEAGDPLAAPEPRPADLLAATRTGSPRS